LLLDLCKEISRSVLCHCFWLGLGKLSATAKLYNEQPGIYNIFIVFFSRQICLASSCFNPIEASTPIKKPP
jgi:hypothetical protein